MERKMFCYQCQEANKNQGCQLMGVCGKTPHLANTMDAFKYVLKGLAITADQAYREGGDVQVADLFLMEGLFKLITNANFSEEVFQSVIVEGIALRESLKQGLASSLNLPITQWASTSIEDIRVKGWTLGALACMEEDIRSAREVIFNGLMGMAAYHSHAHKLGATSQEIFDFTRQALVALCDDALSLADYVTLLDETGKYAVAVMALLDEANTTRFGAKEISEVALGVRNNPGILISGHDLHDLHMLLEQSKDSGVDIYTHSEMLPAHYYPQLKQYEHLVGNYGNAWWKQKEEFESFHGPILFTTNCIVPPSAQATYQDRVYTTSNTGYPGWKHIPTKADGTKDFSALIAHAKTCAAPQAIEHGTIVGGFGHQQVLALAPAVVEAIKQGAISKFVVMAGCDGRHPQRSYYTEFAKALPQDTIILTAGCAKFRYNKLKLGDINGIPRVLDAGQCNDSYSLALIALKLAEVFECDVNDLPIAYNIAWYEQKAVTVLLALLHLGVKRIVLGPTLPAFLSANVANFLVNTFEMSTVQGVEADLARLIHA
ncbi:MAG: hydroxylamine reductase [Erysipelotrichaceae bacterium]